MGNRVIYMPPCQDEHLYDEDLQEQERKTKAFRKSVQRHLNYWEGTLTSAGLDVLAKAEQEHRSEGEEAPKNPSATKPLVHTGKSDQFAHLLGLPYQQHFKDLSTKIEFFIRVAPLFTPTKNPDTHTSGIL